MLLSIENEQSDSCGTPPTIDTSAGRLAYMQNEYGEQMILQEDAENRRLRFWHGDCGWDVEFHVNEFRGVPVVVPAGTVVESCVPPVNQTKEEVSFRRVAYQHVRKQFKGIGKPLSDTECEYVLRQPALNSCEIEWILSVWQMWFSQKG